MEIGNNYKSFFGSQLKGSQQGRLIGLKIRQEKIRSDPLYFRKQFYFKPSREKLIPHDAWSKHLSTVGFIRPCYILTLNHLFGKTNTRTRKCNKSCFSNILIKKHCAGGSFETLRFVLRIKFWWHDIGIVRLVCH